MLFLSYAEEDREVASRVASWFANQGIELFNWLAPNQRGRQFVREIEEAIDRADAFLALLSPHLLSSPWCRRERHLALLRENDLQERQGDRIFIHVLQVASTPRSDAGFLRGYDWGDIVDKTDISSDLTSLTERIRSHTGDSVPSRQTATNPVVAASPSSSSVTDFPMQFRNRTSELDEVLLSITNFSGPHFWLVTSPPHLGKSWFLQRLRSDEKLTNWKSELVDLRQAGPEIRSDADALLASLFGLQTPVIDWPTTRREIVKKIASAKAYLCLLDSAELIDQRTAHALRTRLAEIHALLKSNYANNIRLAVVVASRRDAEWRGVTPHPRMTVLPLSEFDDIVVQLALFDFAETANRGRFAADLRPTAELVHQVTEGLPALLPRCLQWIQDEQWFELERLNTQSHFEGLAEPYIREGLLSYDSLFPGRRVAGDDTTDPAAKLKSLIVERAYRALVPYRLFTQSHLRYHLQYDDEICDILARLGWSLEDLWNAVSDSALLLRPLDEPWQEIHPAIRRLLYRYCYATRDQRAAAHEEARKFVAVWGEQQLGKEQTIGLIECLWHEAMALAHSDEEEFKGQLSHSATELSLGLKPSPLYTVEELRQYTAGRMIVDTELADAFKHAEGFFQQLIEIVANPPSPAGDLT